MKVIDKHNFLAVVCVSFTLVVCGKLLLEAMSGTTDPFYAVNIFICLVICILATGILALHYYLQRFPFLPVVIGQYLVLMGLIFAAIWIGGKYVDISSSAYWDMFRSVTIPYAIGAAAYYISYFLQIRKANALLEGLE